MASFWGLLMAMTLIVMTSPTPSQSLPYNKLNKLETTITSEPAVPPTTTTTPTSSSTQISPDIAPLLPSSGGAVPSTTGSSMPIIPSNPSQNPDGMPVYSPDSAVSPSGSLPASAAVSLNLLRPLNLAVYMVFWSCWSVLVFAV